MTGMPQPTPKCSKCRDTKHIVRNGKWTRCPCVTAKIRGIDLARAGVDDVFHNTKVSVLGRAWGIAPEHVFDSDDPAILWLRGPSLGQRRASAVAWLLSYAVDQSLTAATITLSQSIDAKFDREDQQTWNETLRDTKVLVVIFDAAATGKMLPVIAERIVSARANMHAVTLFVSSDDLRALPGKYGAAVCGFFKERFRSGPTCDTGRKA